MNSVFLNEFIEWLKNLSVVSVVVFSIYKLFFHKKQNDLNLDDNKIRFLKELQEFEEGKFRKMMDDYNLLVGNEIKMKLILEEQDFIIKKYKKRNSYLESELKKHNISFRYE
jgi:hypothetical protein